MELSTGLALKGRLGLRLHDAETGALVARRNVDNLIVTSGINLLASALNYALVQAEANLWGNPYTNPAGAMYAAVGTSATPASAGQTALVAETGRALVSNSAVSAGLLVYDHFMPTSLGNGSINELGVFGAANLLTPTLTSALTNGSTYTSLTVGNVVAVIPNGSTLVLGYGTGNTQTVTTTSQVNVGATSIPVTSFVASFAYPAGTLAAYTPGTLIDRAVLATPVVKTSAQTMIVELSLTLASG